MSTLTHSPAAPSSPAVEAQPERPTVARRGHIGRIVSSTMAGGLLLAIAAVVGPFAGAEEHVITGAVLASFALSWAALAFLSRRWTDQPQPWAKVPATALAVASATVLVLAPTGDPAGWVWPPLVLALVAWMVVHSRRALRSRARVLVLYPVFAVLALSAVGGAYQTYREATVSLAMPGRLVDVGDHRLHLNCTGTGSPTVVLEAGQGEASPIMAALIAPGIDTSTRVCVYDRAGRGWSEAASHPQDGVEVAADLHTLLDRAGEDGPYVLAGHSAGGIYVLNFANSFSADVAGVVLLDSMHPEQYTRMGSWPGFYEMFRRASAVLPSLNRLGVGQLVNARAYGDLPEQQRAEQRHFTSTPRHARSARDEFHRIRTAMDQAARLETLGNLPLVVVTAEREADEDWASMQADLVALSSNSVQRVLPDADHAMVVGHPDAARQASQAILEAVRSIRTGTPLVANAG